MKSIDFSKVNIRVISIEVSKIDEVFDGKWTQLRYLMKQNGYELYKKVEEDFIYVRKEMKTELWIND